MLDIAQAAGGATGGDGEGLCDALGEGTGGGEFEEGATIGHGMSYSRKVFFSEEKNQKTFISAPALRFRLTASAGAGGT